MMRDYLIIWVYAFVDVYANSRLFLWWIYQVKGQRFILLVCSLSIYSRPPTQFPVYTTIALPYMILNFQGFAKIYKMAYSRDLIRPYSLVSSKVVYSYRYKACD